MWMDNELKRDEKRRQDSASLTAPLADLPGPDYCPRLVLFTPPWVFVRNKHTGEYETLSTRSHEKMENICRGDAVKWRPDRVPENAGVLLKGTWKYNARLVPSRAE